MDVQVADEIDRRIIDALRADGRRPFRRIAAELGVSESTVRARYARLSSLGIVQVVGLADLHTVGTVEGHLSIQVLGGETRRLAEELGRRPEVRLVAAAVGAADLVLDVVFPNPGAFQRFITSELPAYGGVRRVEFLRTAEVIKDSYVWEG
ncbi:Lrp/AsnC family transcriptional regulator [Leucobacter allii]|uniref:Lrp/AsnC family transcriptional regulator n=1 Tax=Leucobacter allii TaxID=2932247 RepID=A0ABY4FL51_9MICO|nr:Lrp/AsnC family transcriptional regulator [Leucobacter allii]UOQ56994.1 Lrp/AsnC family transcriptional regulator [Leucobacter allii]UOR01464.1 Lrp/AsnC family transcriptional regulator [Leucobacter allii]